MLRFATSSPVLRNSSLIGLFWIMGLTAAGAQAPTITQSTQGWCSPAVGQTGGNVTIVCQGVSPKALDRLNELLDKKDLELQAKIQEAEAWAQKYRELQERLTHEGRDDVLAQTAKALLEEGKLAEAGAILDRLLASGERQVEQVAADHFNRAEVYALQFQPYNALPHYEKAYRYRPDNVPYAFQYALTLQKQHHYTQAQTVYQEALGTYRKLAETNPQAYLPNVAMTLNNLGNLYRATQRLSESEQAFQEALGIRRKLAETNPQAYLPDVAATLNNLAILEFTQDHMQQAHVLVSEALTIRRGLWKKYAVVYGNALAQSLAVEAMVLLRTEKETSLVCERLHEMRNVAVSEGLKQWANERAKDLCDKADDDKAIIRKQ